MFARSGNTRDGQCRIVVDGGDISNTLFLPRRVSQTFSSGNTDAVPAYVQNKSQPIYDPTRNRRHFWRRDIELTGSRRQSAWRR